MHRFELQFANGKSFSETSDGLMSHVLFEIIYSDEKVGVTGFQAITVEKLLDQLDVADIGLFTLYLHSNGVIERCQQAERLQYPAEIFVNEASIALILVLLKTL